jgi:putative CocE/NonD family hydrolase
LLRIPFTDIKKTMTTFRTRYLLNTSLLLLCCFCLNGATSGQQAPLAERYDKSEFEIPMRDGTKLFTAVYTPKDKSRSYPFMINRTCYSCNPYGVENYPGRIGPSKIMEDEGYIFVRQDVRGRWMSEGKFDNMRPHVPGDESIDESSDTWDTVEWLIKNVPNNNGKAGMWGISYPGFYSAAALPEHHPALVAVSPQAPISDFFFDDFHHQGAYLLSYFMATPTFGYQHAGPTKQKWYPEVTPASQDGWQFYMDLGALKNADKYFGQDNFFWQEIVSHPNYDEFWQKRSILPHLKNVTTNVLVVGGLFDAEDLYGPLNIYRELEKNNPSMHNTIVMGPWGHGDWSRGSSFQRVGYMPFDRETAIGYQTDIEAPFFRHFLKGEGPRPDVEARFYDTGSRRWNTFAQWPPANAVVQKLYLAPEKKLVDKPSGEKEGFVEFVSDPADPVPYRERKDIRLQFTPREYMTDDQRFAALRPDVLVYETPVLTEPVTLAGNLAANLFVSTDQSDADWIVKLIDVFPADHPQLPGTPEGINLAGYQFMVRSEVFRGRFRNSFVTPEPFKPNEVTAVKVPLQDVHHTFKPGHRLMIQVQSTWFPLIDRNPQKYVENIYKADAQDFVSARHRVHHSAQAPSHIELLVMPQK